MAGFLAGCSHEPAKDTVITGHVYLASGEPCVTCPMGISSPDHATDDIAQLTGGDGSYRWHVPGGGTYTVALDGEAGETVKVQSGETRTLDITLP